MLKPTYLIALTAVALAAAACTESTTPTSDLASIEVTPRSAVLSQEGGNVARFTAVGHTDAGAVARVRFHWRSSDTTVATVDPDEGVVTGLKDGRAAITASAHGLTVTATVTVSRSSCATCQSVPTDRTILTEFYRATNGNEWTNDTNWTSDKPLNTWYGVTATSDDRVTHLSLPKNNLVGKLPPALRNLSELSSFTLSGNKLSGSIPELGGILSGGILSKLKHLDLSDNLLSGSIPRSLFQTLTLEILTRVIHEVADRA